MLTLRSRPRRLTATLLAIVVGSPGVAAQKSTPAPAPAAAEATWPRAYDVAGGRALLYQPQVASWNDRKQLVAWSAVSYLPQGAKEPSLGTVKIQATTEVALDERLVRLADFTIVESNFGTLDRGQARELVAALQKGMPGPDKAITLDHLLAAIDKSAITPRETPGIKADPPNVYASSTPAVLVTFDGDPVWSPIKDLDLKFAVNTNWDVFEHTPGKTLYLRNDASWLKATSVEGPWSPAGPLPASFTRLPADDNWKDVKAHVPGTRITSSAVPKVFVTTGAAELLLTAGSPQYQPVAGTGLLWVSNTESDLFRLGKDGAFYYLVAGRWFSAPSLDGPWTFATPSLPADFRKIPVEHPRSRVLASVPGTDQATEAVLLASLPHTARVAVRQLKAPDVVYQGGGPKLEPIATTKVERVVNTDKDIVKVGADYYMCYEAVWFTSRSAEGPWTVATAVPAEIYAIPASSPVHHVTYVTVEDDGNSADEWVTFAYVAGYVGMSIAWGCAVWGTGWYYPPYVWYGGLYPAYFWYPRTYGFGAWYNPWTGRYGRGAAAYGPFGGAGAAAVYNPRTGTYARGAAAYGPYGAHGVAEAWNPRTGTYARTRQGGNIYGNWGTSYVQRGDEWARTTRRTNYATGATTRTIRGDDGAAITRRGTTGRTTIGRGEDGDIYAGHNGSVYRRDGDGTWQHWSDGGWQPADRPDRGTTRPGEGGAGTRDWPATRGQLDGDHRARAEGHTRARDWGSYRANPSRQRAGSFRGGGFHGRRR
jgi:hypothetical protein